MVTAAYSSSKEVAEELISYFVDIGNRECFAAMLYVCFDLLSSDFVEELSWQHGLNDFYMPYRIQVQRALVAKVRNSAVVCLQVFKPTSLSQVEALEKKVAELSAKDSKKEQQEADAPIINPGGFGNRLMLTQGNGFVPQGPPPMMNGTGMPTGIPSVSPPHASPSYRKLTLQFSTLLVSVLSEHPFVSFTLHTLNFFCYVLSHYDSLITFYCSLNNPKLCDYQLLIRRQNADI